MYFNPHMNKEIEIKIHINGHNWEAIAVFDTDAVNQGLRFPLTETRPLLLVKCRECSDERVLYGRFFGKG